MPILSKQLDLDRCPHCYVDKPTLDGIHSFDTTDYLGLHKRAWVVYVCVRCGGAVIGAGSEFDTWVKEYYPRSEEIDSTIPEPAQNYLSQAMETIHAPAGSIMLSASAVDAMLKNKGYTEGSLYTRIDKAAEDHLITEGMASWAHQVRLDANAQRHADEDQALPSQADARSTLDFAKALGEFIFVLPAKIAAGIVATSPEEAA